MSSQWIPVTEALPEHFKTVWGYQECADLVTDFFFDGDHWFFAGGPLVPQCHVTHWREIQMLVPEKPDIALANAINDLRASRKRISQLEEVLIWAGKEYRNMPDDQVLVEKIAALGLVKESRRGR